MAVEAYKVRLDTFEGPLDLLLHLCRTNEVDIYNLPVAVITDQYLQYVELFEELNLNVAGEYLVMAASLMYMKSRLLLPADEDEEEEEEDSVGDLVRQLAEYQRYREAAEELRDRVLLDRDVFARDPTPPPAAEGEEPGIRKVGMADLFEALRLVLERAAARRPHTVAGEEFRVTDAVRSMIGRLKEGGRLEFRELFRDDSPRGLIIANFVGLLELMKLQLIEAEQEVAKGPIFLRLVEREGEDTEELITAMYGAGAARSEFDEAEDS